MNYINTFFNGAVHLLYPRLCRGCGSDIISDAQTLCIDCIDALPLTNFYGYDDNPVEKIFRGRLPIATAVAHVYFTKQSMMQELLHQLKYKGRREIGTWFGRRMGENMKASSRYSDIDVLVPLPLFHKKEKKRGYNQANVICEGISEVMKLPIAGDAIARTGETETQTHKGRLERWDNIEGKFTLRNGAALKGKHVLLVDDVLTTGATLEACGRELLHINNIKLSIATLAYTSL